MSGPASARVDLAAVAHNIGLLRAAAPSAALLAVVKADGYGHGMVAVARASLAAGAAWLGVTSPAEALGLRAAGIDAPVLAWLAAPGDDYAGAVAAGITLAVSSAEQLEEVLAPGRTADIFLKVDTGLHRNGVPLALLRPLAEAVARAQSAGRVRLVGTMSHLACADVPDHPTIAGQRDALIDAADVVAAAGLDPGLLSLANSAATLTRPDTHFSLVRPGIAVYGLSPVPALGDFGLHPAMTLRAPVALTKRVPAGSGVSYGHTYVTSAETTLALLPVGYGDGIPRAAGGRGPVGLGGHEYRIAGRVCMDQVVLDVGDAPVRRGDDAVFFGAGGPSAQQWAEELDTLSYEIVTRVGARVPREYV